MHRCINLTAGAVGRFENPEGMGWMRTFGGDCFSPISTKNLEGLEGNSPPPWFLWVFSELAQVTGITEFPWDLADLG